MGVFEHFPYTNFHDLNLDWIISHFNEFIEEISSLNDWRSQHEAEYQELKKFMDEIEAGTLPPAVYNELHDWFINNAFDLVGEMVKHVYFGLDDNGHFMVTIPQQWRDLVFKTTGYDFNTPLQSEFGHLCLLY